MISDPACASPANTKCHTIFQLCSTHWLWYGIFYNMDFYNLTCSFSLFFTRNTRGVI